MVEQDAVEHSLYYILNMVTKRTYADRREYNIKAVAKRRRKIRLMAINLLGGKCSRCGYNRCSAALDFHHTDEDQKSFGLSERGMTRSWEKTKKEVYKCILLCANCHREIHVEQSQPLTVMSSENGVNSRKPKP